jgi:hypothetical protein
MVVLSLMIAMGRVPGRLVGGGGDSGVGDAFGDDSVEGVHGGEQFGWGVGSVGGHQWPQDVVVDLGVEVGEEEADDPVRYNRSRHEMSNPT